MSSSERVFDSGREGVVMKGLGRGWCSVKSGGRGRGGAQADLDAEKG